MQWALFGLWLGLLGGLRLEIVLLRYGERRGACGGLRWGGDELNGFAYVTVL